LHASVDNEKVEGYRRPSYSGSESDDFSLWSDTGDLAEQLTNSEDPLRIELDPLTRGGRRLNGVGRGHGGGRKKKVGFQGADDPDHDKSAGGLDKEAIHIPEPGPRRIGRFETLLALIMAPSDPAEARAKGLVGKPLLCVSIQDSYAG
jgi:hypothetical protein